VLFYFEFLYFPFHIVEFLTFERDIFELLETSFFKTITKIVNKGWIFPG